LLLASLDRLITAGRLAPTAVTVHLVGEMDPARIEEYSQPLERLRSLGSLWASGLRLSPAEANRHIAEADFLLLLDLNESGSSVQVPAKLFDYMCARRPILAFSGPDSPTSRILAASGVEHALLFPNMPEAQIDDLVMSFLKPGPRRSEANEWFWSQFDGISQAGQLAAILDSAPPAAPSESPLRTASAAGTIR